MHIHFTGIGGIGMSALAQLCHARGDIVTGSDRAENPMTEILRSQGMGVECTQTTESVPFETELLVYTEAVGEENPERQEALRRGIPQKSYFEYLGDYSAIYRTIAVAGTHGKTTTTGIVASGMIGAGLDPTVVVGAQLPLFEDTNVRHGQGGWLVVEACEYRDNFKFLSPEVVIITNIELDHVDYYQSEEQYIEAYRSFIKNAKCVICHPNDSLVEQVLDGFLGEVLYTEPKELSLKLIGEHNQANAQLAIALEVYLQKESSPHMRELFFEGIECFSGCARRQEYIGKRDGIHIYDDYGHHPTEIAATYQAFCEAFPGKKVGLIFEPHQYSRTRELFDGFANVLQEIKPLGIMPIYEARDTEEDKQAVSTEMLTDASDGIIVETKEEALGFMQKYLKEGDVLVCMGAGGISGFAHELVAQ